MRLFEKNRVIHSVHPQLTHVKIEIALITAPAYRAVPLKDDAAHISVDTVIAQAESARQFLAAQQFAILHIAEHLPCNACCQLQFL